MKIALFSDVHANLPALEAVLEDLARRDGVSATYHLGDLVGYAPWPNETVARIRQEGIPGVAGNYDSTTATRAPHCGCRSENPAQEALAHASYAWTQDHLSDESRRWLGALPFRMDIRPQGGHQAAPTLMLMHGSPTLNTLYWTQDRSDEFCLRMAERCAARPGDLLAFGHTHQPWAREIGGIQFVNTGSVGKPKDGDWRAGYVLLDPPSAPGARWGIEFVRVEYNLRRAVEGIRASTLPDEFAELLLRGGTD
jgi:predicted phosphodiesterase